VISIRDRVARSEPLGTAPDRFAVVALFRPAEDGGSFGRSAWPAHVTLCSNFVVDASADEVVSAVRRSGALSEPVVVQFGGLSMFGRDRDIRVRLVVAARASALHRDLTDQLESLPGFAADEPDFWRDGYRPHLTLSATVSGEEGQRRRAACVAVVRLTGDDATIVAAFALPDEGIGVNADIPGPAASGVPRLARRDVAPAQPDVTPPNALGDA
jgi:hypothetical protein